MLIPGVRDPGFATVGQEEQRPGAFEGDYAKSARDRRDVHPPLAASGGRVIVTVVDEDPQLEREEPARAQHAVADVRCVGARLHPDTLLDERVADRVRPHRGRPVQDEALDRAVALRIDRSSDPAIGRERSSGPVVRDGVVHLGDEERAAEGWFERCDEQAMVAARQGARDGPRRAAADAIGTEPLPPLRCREISADLSAPADHASRLLRCSPTRSALAMIVSAGFTAALDGKKLASTT